MSSTVTYHQPLKIDQRMELGQFFNQKARMIYIEYTVPSSRALNWPIEASYANASVGRSQLQTKSSTICLLAAICLKSAGQSWDRHLLINIDCVLLGIVWISFELMSISSKVTVLTVGGRALLMILIPLVGAPWSVNFSFGMLTGNFQASRIDLVSASTCFVIYGTSLAWISSRLSL